MMFIFRIFSLILILESLVSLTFSELYSTPPDVKINNIKVKTTINSTNFNALPPINKTKTSATIVGEGGEKFRPEDFQTTTKGTTEQSGNITHAPIARTYGREGESAENDKVKLVKDVTEGTTLKNTTTGNVTTEAIKPVIEVPVTEKAIVVNTQPTRPSHSRIVPKKGVDFNETISEPTVISSTVVSGSSSAIITKTISVTTTVKPIKEVKQVHKPTVTIGTHDENNALTKEQPDKPIPKVPTIEYYQRKEEDNKRSSFVIPIVAVILSVPIVAIVINILYKRCKEWWTHRHYSRMDFLIDGMYNN